MVDEKKDQQDKDDNSNKRDSAVGDNNGSATTDGVDMSAPRTFSAVPADLSSLRALYEVPLLPCVVDGCFDGKVTERCEACSGNRSCQPMLDL
ncbi:hypothetical protein LTR95_002152 [Oleoguttula sp. CCFEE 5521]